MSHPARIAKLEELLERIQKNRRLRPGPLTLHAVSAAVEPAAGSATSAPSGLPEAFPPEPTTEERMRVAKPTPMEEALETEFEAHTDVEVEVNFEDEGPEITIDEEGEITTEIGGPSVSAPPPTAASLEPLVPQPIEASRAKPSQPIARVVARPAPAEAPTFGMLLARTLALRPR